MRYRDFLRVSMSAGTARWIEKNIVDKTFEDHLEKCASDEDDDCHHKKISLPVARALAAGLKIGKRRATLDLQCPYAVEDTRGQRELLLCVAYLLQRFAEDTKGLHARRVSALGRIAEAAKAYANRNPMMVIAKAASD